MIDVSLSKLFPLLLHKFSNERDLLDAIIEVSIGFTTDRNSIWKYLNDERLVSAYTAFYFLSNIPKLSETLRRLPPAWVEEISRATFIDVGAGPGTFSVAWRELTGRTPCQIETAPVMRKAAEKLWRGLYPDADLLTEVPAGPHLLFFGHSANEMKLAGVSGYVEKFSPDHILFIEPGTKEFFSEMLLIREYLQRAGYDVLYPCPSGAPCPLKGTEDWCHQFIQVRQDPELERLSQIIRKDRKLLPLTVQAYSRTFKLPTVPIRIVRVLPETKFSFEWQVCEGNVLVSYQIMKRHLTREEEKLFASVLAGAAVEVEVEKILGTTKRVKVTRII